MRRSAPFWNAIPNGRRPCSPKNARWNRPRLCARRRRRAPPPEPLQSQPSQAELAISGVTFERPLRHCVVCCFLARKLCRVAEIDAFLTNFGFRESAFADEPDEVQAILCNSSRWQRASLFKQAGDRCTHAGFGVGPVLDEAVVQHWTMDYLTPIEHIPAAVTHEAARVHHDHVNRPSRLWKFDRSLFPVEYLGANPLLRLQGFAFLALPWILGVRSQVRTKEWAVRPGRCLKCIRFVQADQFHQPRRIKINSDVHGRIP